MLFRSRGITYWIYMAKATIPTQPQDSRQLQTVDATDEVGSRATVDQARCPLEDGSRNSQPDAPRPANIDLKTFMAHPVCW